MSVIQFISIDSESLISALSFFILFSKEGALFIIVVMGREHSKDVVYAELHSSSIQTASCFGSAAQCAGISHGAAVATAHAAIQSRSGVQQRRHSSHSHVAAAAQ